LIDEAASRLRIEIDSMPEEIDELTRRRIQLEIEREALRKETDERSKERLEDLERELADVNEEIAALTARWEQEKEAITAIQDAKSQIEETKAEAARAERDGDLQKAAELRYGRLVELEKELAARQEQLEKPNEQGRRLSEEVEEEDIAEVPSRRTGSPDTRLRKGA